MPSLETVFKWLIGGAVVVIVAMVLPTWVGVVASVGLLLVFLVMGAALIGIATLLATFGILPALLLLIWAVVSGHLFHFSFDFPEIEMINWFVQEHQFVADFPQGFSIGLKS